MDVNNKVEIFRSVDEFINFYSLEIPKGYDKFEVQLSETCRSSYIKHRFGRIFSAITYNFRFQSILELGVLDGYSLFSMAFGCSSKKIKTDAEDIVGVDLFDDYSYKKGKKTVVQQLIQGYGFQDFVKLRQGDIFNDDSIMNIVASSNLIHVDLSNDGGKVADIIKMIPENCDALIIFEGGSNERDNVEWMLQYKKPPLRESFINIAKGDKYNVSIIEEFPSLTILSTGDFLSNGK
jgi:hypothetical protein